MPLRLNRKQLVKLIEDIEAEGNDASILRQELAVLGPEEKPGPSRGGPKNEEREETTEERLTRRVGYLFPNGIPFKEIFEYDYRFSQKELIQQCREAGIGLSGDKKELAAKLIANGTKLSQTLPQTGTCYQDAWRFVIREGEGELVHGSVQTIGKRIDHAWVETETGYVWEPESREFMKEDHFYERAEPKVEARYTVEEAAVLVARTGNFGPWTKEEAKGYGR